MSFEEVKGGLYSGMGVQGVDSVIEEGSHCIGFCRFCCAFLNSLFHSGPQNWYFG